MSNRIFVYNRQPTYPVNTFSISDEPSSGGYLKGLQDKIDGIVTRINGIETGGGAKSNVIYYYYGSFVKYTFFQTLFA